MHSLELANEYLGLSKNVADDILIFILLFSRENKAWHFIWICWIINLLSVEFAKSGEKVN